MATALRTWSLLLLSLFLAANLQPANAGKAAPPQVTLATGTTLNGIADTKNGIAVWKGEQLRLHRNESVTQFDLLRSHQVSATHRRH